MRRMTVWLAKLVAAGLIISFLSIWTTGYVVNSYVETLLKQFNIPLETQPMALSGVWGKLWGADPVTAEAPSDTDSDTDAERETPDSPSEGTIEGAAGKQGGAGERDSSAGNEPSPSPGPLTGIGGGSGASAGAEPPEDGAGAADGAFGGETPGGTANGSADAPDASPDSPEEGTASTLPADDTEVAITTDNMTEIKNQMSDADKNKLFGLLMEKLPQEAWQSISAYVENGLTDEELTDVEQIMAQHLSSEEYKQMMEILKKY
ncbi:hypothetical protein ACFSL6_10735 [Paenibacillus thailandensis]|uniref:Spore coat protein n=1 Tax=Paenibacillus thailandensis TaxID=393250 RepID=A0ABW5R1W3_9BACL